MAEKQKTVYELNVKKSHYNLPNVLFGAVDNSAKGDKCSLILSSRNSQENGKIVPYFSIHHVVIPKEKSEEYLRSAMKGMNYETNIY